MSMSLTAVDAEDRIVMPRGQEAEMYAPDFDPDSIDLPPPNPDYRPETDFTVANGNGFTLASQLGIAIDSEVAAFDLSPQKLRDTILTADVARLSPYVRQRLPHLLAATVIAIERGATRIYLA